MRIKQDKIPWAKPILFGNEKEYLTNAIDSTWISGGSYVDQLEERFSQLMDVEYGITTSNGTTALQLAIKAISLNRGDEVIVPGFTFIAPANMVLEEGGVPVYTDIDSKTWCLDPEAVRKNITSKTKAIIPVHTYGNICDMDSIMTIAKEYNLRVIEDTAEACLSKYKGKYSGTFGDIGCFSFQATKTITTGEGGFVATNDTELHKKMRLIRNHGMRQDKHYFHDAIGYNFRLTNLQAALGCAQLDNIDKIILQRKEMYGQYRQELENEDGITLQYFDNSVEPVVWAVAVKIDSAIFGLNRDGIMASLLKEGIESRPGFYTGYDMPIYKAPKLKVAQEISQQVISLPSYPLLNREEIKYVCDRVKDLRK